MGRVEFNFDEDSFNKLYPFFILLDKKLKITSLGKSVRKVCKDLDINSNFNDSFSIRKSNAVPFTFENKEQFVDQLIVLDYSKDKLVLRGQFQFFDDSILFLGTPWFVTMDQITGKNLVVSDFSISDPLLELLSILNNQEITTKELNEYFILINKQKEELKKDKEELNKISLVASANKNGVVFTDPLGKIFWCNQSYSELTGFSSEEIIGKTPIDIGRCHLSTPEELNKMVSAFYKGELFNVEGYHAHKEGKPFWAKIKGQPVYDKNNKLIQYFAIVENSDDEKEKEEQLSILSSIAKKNINSVIICDKEGKIEWVNDSFIEMSGFPIEELLDKKPGQLLQGPDTDKETIIYLANQIKKGLPFNCEIINYSKKKKKYWVRIQGQALHNKNGEVFKFFAIEEDITLEKEFNQQLIESENRLTSLIENLQSGILLEDENRKIVIVNKKFCNMFGIEQEPDLMKGVDCEMAAQNTKHFFKNSDYFLERIDEILKDREKVIAEEIELVDGRIFERSFLPIYKEGKYAGHLWSYEDITIKKRYKESLEAERQKYSNIIANMNMGLLEVDKNDVVLFANQSFCEMSGYSLLELLGNRASDLVLTSEAKQVIKNKNTIRTKGVSDSYEITSKTKEGDIKHWLISGAPNYNLNGEVTGSIGIHLDITDQKNLELQKEQLLKKLEKQNEQLSEYAQVVSHDLKSPLRSIHSLITWIKEDNEKEFSEQTSQYLSMIESKVEKMDHLIHGILTYSKVDSEDKIDEKININEVVENCINIIHIPENIKVVVSDKLPVIIADKFRMQQLFQNIISNAVYYIDKPEGLVEVGSFEEKDYYVFSIKDNGPGIAKENQEKIFKIFQSFTQHEQSTGIGLSIVKRIIDNYNGEIWVESEMKQGTTFFIKLPKTNK
ncbi:PAS domain S-box protein [Flavobacterium jejuense]|uniref:PAS domain S-box protein n=1 Tax=Flavobacterium jejuense TaxID=1544455 RepID=A0ABX0ITY2_9FLAO|nr:PAS domain S-box protein [Flavobacterium jejuense]NHN26605.1 PAS domain S-box protein [Flavobacterium jejuense]